MAYGKLRRCSAARKALLRDLVTDLILNGKIETTESKAKELKKLADKMVTLAKTNTLASRRQAAKLVRFEKDENNNYISLARELNGVGKAFCNMLNAIQIYHSSSPYFITVRIQN